MAEIVTVYDMLIIIMYVCMNIYTNAHQKAFNLHMYIHTFINMLYLLYIAGKKVSEMYTCEVFSFQILQ